MKGSDQYFTIQRVSEGLYKEKGSRFLAFAYPCSSSDTAKNIIDQLRKEHHQAVHVCFAWRFGTSEPYQDRFSDDGEPSNSAGKPIHGQLIAKDVTNVVIAVVRYYGGTKLGVGGLINAYRTAAADALEQALLIESYITSPLVVRHPFELTGEVMRIVNQSGAAILSQGFENDRPTLNCEIRQSNLDQLLLEFSNYPDISVDLI